MSNFHLVPGAWPSPDVAHSICQGQRKTCEACDDACDVCKHDGHDHDYVAITQCAILRPSEEYRREKQLCLLPSLPRIRSPPLWIYLPHRLAASAALARRAQLFRSGDKTGLAKKHFSCVKTGRKESERQREAPRKSFPI
jgi:hypothetical protein